MSLLRRYFPILDWGRDYSRQTLVSDGMAAVTVTIMLIPQSLAYALLAGLPPEVGLYASILPLLAYAVFGSSRAMAVGPVAVISLITAAAIGRVAIEGSASYLEAAIVLAMLSGLILLAMGLLRLGFIANFLSHQVTSGFITASGLLIATGQLGGMLGVKLEGNTMPDLIGSLFANAHAVNLPTVVLGIVSLGLLLWTRNWLKGTLARLGVTGRTAMLIVRAGPVLTIIVGIAATMVFDLGVKGVGLVGAVPSGLPVLGLPGFNLDLVQALIAPALIVSIIGFVESVSVAQTLAAKKRQRIDPDQELIGLGAANIASSLSGGYPVTGGFARSVVNFDAGAETPAAGAFTAIGIAIATLVLTPYLALLPKATLSATIIVAVLSLVDLSILGKAYRYSRTDFAAVAVTIGATLLFGVETGVISGVTISILIHLYRSSRPHTAIVGRVPETEHFRNVERHQVILTPGVLSLRVDENLYFANARYLEDLVYRLVAERGDLRHLVLMCPAVNVIDMSALESLEAINARLADLGIRFHLSEVKGPVMDRLTGSGFLEHLSGQVFLSQHSAIMALEPAV